MIVGLGDLLTPRECMTVVHATKRSLAGTPPRATLLRPAVLALLVLAVCAAVMRATQRPQFAPQWARIAPP